MNQAEAKATLVECFLALPKRDRARLRYHLENRTPVLCGERAYEYADGEGGA